MSEVEEAIKGVDEAKAKLSGVATWIYTHPNVWEEGTADDVRETVEMLNEDLEQLKEIIRETAIGRRD
jgi:hypothetical protein